MTLFLLSKTSTCFNIPVPVGYFFLQGWPSRAISGRVSMSPSSLDWSSWSQLRNEKGRGACHFTIIKYVQTMTMSFIPLFPELICFKGWNAVGINCRGQQRWTSTTQVKDCCGDEKGKEPPSQPLPARHAPPAPRCLVASTPTSEGASTLSCPPQQLARGQCRFPPLLLPSPAQGIAVRLVPPGIVVRLVPPCLGGHADGEARGAPASSVAFHQTWPLGARALQRNALSPPWDGRSGWWRSLCSCNRLSMPYGVPLLRVATRRWKWDHWQHSDLGDG